MSSSFDQRFPTTSLVFCSIDYKTAYLGLPSTKVPRLIGAAAAVFKFFCLPTQSFRLILPPYNMLRSLPRAAPSSSSLLGGLSIRSSLRRTVQSRTHACAFEAQNQQQNQKRRATTVEVFANPSLTRISGFAALKQQKRHSTAPAHAVSNPMLAGIEKRWEIMPPQEQAELWMALRDRMKNDWHELTLQERRACEFP